MGHTETKFVTGTHIQDTKGYLTHILCNLLFLNRRFQNITFAWFDIEILLQSSCEV
jgi:hypothetical protein